MLGTDKAWEQFDVLEESYFTPSIQIQTLSPQLQLLINIELKQKAIESRQDKQEAALDSIRETVIVQPNRKREWVNNTTNSIIKKNNFDYGKFKTETYVLLNQRAGVNIYTRKFNKMRKTGRDVPCLEIILDDKKLIECYIAILKEYAIKYGVAA